jgi:hypothetical protein
MQQTWILSSASADRAGFKWTGPGIPSQQRKNLPQDPDQVRMIDIIDIIEPVAT